MSTATWLEMPVERWNVAGRISTQPQYPVEGSALMVYRGDKVYVASQAYQVAEGLGRREGVRQLTVDEARQLEVGLPGIGIARLEDLGSYPPQSTDTTKQLLLGDFISWVLRRLGIQECNACSQRKQKLNRIALWKLRAWYRRPGAHLDDNCS